MKHITNSAVYFAAITLGVVTSLTGCSTTGMQKSAKTSATMQVVEQDINKAIIQADATALSLEALVRPGQSDVKKALEKYSDNVAKMETLGKRLIEHADEMSAQGKDYFEEWRKQGNLYTNPQIQALSEQRRADLSAVFVKIPESSIGVKGAFKAYMTDLREIQTYLSNDLTPKGVEAVTPITRKAVKAGNSLKEAANPILSAIGTARAELAVGGTK